MSETYHPNAAVRKHRATLVRRVLIGVKAGPNPPQRQDVIDFLRCGLDAAPETVRELRGKYGISLPDFRPDWDVISTSTGTPSPTIRAYPGDRSQVRMSLHLVPVDDDTSLVELQANGISHLIGVTVDEAGSSSWGSDAEGGMLARIDVPIRAVPCLVHDVLLDMAMAHARGQSWSTLREHLNSYQLAALKADFVRSGSLTSPSFYGFRKGSQYYPLSAFARSRASETDPQFGFDLSTYSKVWTDFATYAKGRNVLPRSMSKADVVDFILSSFKDGQQISRSELESAVEPLESGYYCFYCVERRPRNPDKLAQVFGFLRKPACTTRRQKAIFHTKYWVIWSPDARGFSPKLALQLEHEGYLSSFPFYTEGAT
jgi:hypothetical protein